MPPGAPHLWCCFVNPEIGDARIQQLFAHGDAAKTGPNDDHVQWNAFLNRGVGRP